ncbi:putative polypeptide N-acetylgalactosaminyltransferase 9 [Branchiostoma floridae]|uniref:Polypeptide N-acetylgalactosaminyltransferase 9 n=1 Tax=Branchiostoma floridae TaxID=7739 RepID=A0A9J7MHA4_BRAFL|nr:putative polypeptide N-acetylgalactosaminyltransferase 9 [Branchiostoma floridae]
MMRRACRRHGLGLVCKALKALLTAAALLMVYTYAWDRKSAAPHHHARRVKFAALPVDEKFIKERLDPEPTRGLDLRVRAAMRRASSPSRLGGNASPVNNGSAWLAYAAPRAPNAAKFSVRANNNNVVGIEDRREAVGNDTRLGRGRSSRLAADPPRARIPKRWNVRNDNSNKNGNAVKNDKNESNNGNIGFGVQQATPDVQAPGELGQGVVLRNLSPQDRKQLEEGYKKYAFNEFASTKIPLTRTIPDGRHWLCKSKEYDVSRLPAVSVIICFHNEAWSTLMRTVHSVLRTAPSELLTEVIMVDDDSQYDHLKAQLTDYVAGLPKVKLIRTHQREGLIRARLLGASHARADVLVFLDSHCECNIGWLEPLLDRIVQNRSHVVTPVIDVIDFKTFEYRHLAIIQRGGFDWRLIFRWEKIPASYEKRRGLSVDPILSPTMAGGLFAIDKEYFHHLGLYDTGMEIWGGENLELSFRIWQCGGTLEIMPCSRVGHVFRQRFPYQTSTEVTTRNLMRVAEVWMDQYKEYFYQIRHIKKKSFGDVTERQELRRRLQCRDFHWYLNTIYPELKFPKGLGVLQQ